MAIINLRKYYYPTYKKDTFIEVSDEVAEALLKEIKARITRLYNWSKEQKKQPERSRNMSDKVYAY